MRGYVNIWELWSAHLESLPSILSASQPGFARGTLEGPNPACLPACLLPSLLLMLLTALGFFLTLGAHPMLSATWWLLPAELITNRILAKLLHLFGKLIPTPYYMPRATTKNCVLGTLLRPTYGEITCLVVEKCKCPCPRSPVIHLPGDLSGRLCSSAAWHLPLGSSSHLLSGSLSTSAPSHPTPQQPCPGRL